MLGFLALFLLQLVYVGCWIGLYRFTTGENRKISRYIWLLSVGLHLVWTIYINWELAKSLLDIPKYEEEYLVQSYKDGLLSIYGICVIPIGVVSLMGGKWTSYRKMCEDAVDTVV